MICETIEIENQQLELHPLKAIFWKEKKVLILSDIHFGKVNHFRKEGLALPAAAKEKDYQNLAFLLKHYTPKKLFIIGDLFHSTKNKEWEKLASLQMQFKEVEWLLVAGNHDNYTLKEYAALNIKVVQNYTKLPFYFTHEPEDNLDLYTISGHLHPGVILNGKGKQKLRLSCFYFAKKQAILPAFGTLTGKYIIKPSKQDNVFVISATEVLKVQ